MVRPIAAPLLRSITLRASGSNAAHFSALAGEAEHNPDMNPDPIQVPTKRSAAVPE